MAHVMIAEENPIIGQAQAARDVAAHPEFVAEPGHHRFAPQAQGAGKSIQRRLQNALELLQRLLVKDDVFQVARRDARLLQTEFSRQLGEAIVMLNPREALFHGGGDQLAIFQQCGGRVMVKGGDAQNIHR